MRQDGPDAVSEDEEDIEGKEQEEGTDAEAEVDDEEEGRTDDEERHQRMLADVKAATSGGRPVRRQMAVVNEVYPESEFNMPPAQGPEGAFSCGRPPHPRSPAASL